MEGLGVRGFNFLKLGPSRPAPAEAHTLSFARLRYVENQRLRSAPNECRLATPRSGTSGD